MEDPDAATADAAQRLIRGKRKKALLVLAGSAVLALGSLAAPRSNEADPPAAVPQEPAAPLIQGVAQREAFRGLRLLQESGRSVVRHTATLAVRPATAQATPGRVEITGPTAPAPSLPAVVVRPSSLLANLRALGGASPRTLAIVGTTAQAVLERCDPDTGLALFRATSGIEIPPAPLRTEETAVGDAGVAVARVGGILTLDPVLVAGTEDGRVRLALARLVPGTPVFDTDGRLAAVASAEGGGWTIGAALRRLDALGHPIPAVLGVSLQPLTGDLPPPLDGPGAVITDVERGGAAEAAGLQPGDVLVRIGEEVASANTALSSLSPERPVRLKIRRATKEMDVVVTPEAACTVRPTMMSAPDGPPARDLFPAESLSLARVPSEAVVLSIDGAAPTLRTSKRGPRLVRFQTAGQPPFFAVVRP